MQPTTDTPQSSDPGLIAIARWREGMARLRMQLTIGQSSRGYNPEFISLTVEKYHLNCNDIMLAHCQIQKVKV